MSISLGLGLGLTAGFGSSAFDPTALTSFRSQFLGSALQTDTAGHNTYTVVGSPTHGTQNGKTTEIFNGSSDRLAIAALSLGASGGMTVAIACKVTSNDATDRAIWTYTDGAFDQTLIDVQNGKLLLNDGVAANAGTATIAGSWKRIIVTAANGVGNVKAYVNGTLDVSGGSASHPVADNLASQVANYLSFCAVEIAEILLFKAVLSSTDRGNVDAYLSTKYAI